MIVGWILHPSLFHPVDERVTNLHIDHVISTKTGLVDRVEIGYSLDGKMDDTQYPDHNPVISTLSTPNSRFCASDTESYNWFNLSKENWKLINKHMESAAVRFLSKSETPPDVAMTNFVRTFKEVRSKFVKLTRRKQNSKPFFDNQLRTLKTQLKTLRRKVFKERRRSIDGNIKRLEREYQGLRKRYSQLYD